MVAGNPRQNLLELASSLEKNPEKSRLLLEHARLIGRERGIDETFKRYNINVLIGPAESAMSTFAAAAGILSWINSGLPATANARAGYPIASLPLGYLDFNGRPHALAAIAAAHQEATLVQLQSAWEASFPARKTPLCSWTEAAVGEFQPPR